eukprot:s70_g21.t1
MTEPERLAFCAAVLRARGAEWMRERLRALKKESMRNLARKLGICVNPLNKPKGLDRLMDEVMQQLAPSTVAWLCMSPFRYAKIALRSEM